MPAIHLHLQGDDAWPDLVDVGVIDYQGEWHLARLSAGMSSGKTSIALRFDLPDGQALVAQTSLAAWLAATRALEAAEVCQTCGGSKQVLTISMDRVNAGIGPPRPVYVKCPDCEHQP